MEEDGGYVCVCVCVRVYARVLYLFVRGIQCIQLQLLCVLVVS